jgi:hypothetical protein
MMVSLLAEDLPTGQAGQTAARTRGCRGLADKWTNTLHWLKFFAITFFAVFLIKFPGL